MGLLTKFGVHARRIDSERASVYMKNSRQLPMAAPTRPFPFLNPEFQAPICCQSTTIPHELFLYRNARQPHETNVSSAANVITKSTWDRVEYRGSAGNPILVYRRHTGARARVQVRGHFVLLCDGGRVHQTAGTQLVPYDEFRGG